MADKKRKNEETGARSLSDKKFHRASRRFDDLQDYDHPEDTRYKGAVQFKDNPAARSNKSSNKSIADVVPAIDSFFEEDPYEIKSAKEKRAVKARSKKAKAQKEAEVKAHAAKHLKDPTSLGKKAAFAIADGTAPQGDSKSSDANTPANKKLKALSSKPKHAAPAPHKLGYKAPVEDALEAATVHVSGDARGDVQDEQLDANSLDAASINKTRVTQPVSHKVGYKNASDKLENQKSPGGNRKKVLKALAIVAAAFLGVAFLGLVAWMNRTVTFTLNDKEETARAGTLLTTIMDREHIKVNPGNLVSVSGNVLEEDKGNAFSVKVNNEDIPFDTAKDLRVFGEEAIEVGDGANVMEPYDSQTQAQQPTMTMHGTWGSVGFISQWPRVGKIEMRTGQISHETAPGDVIEPLQDAIVTNKLIEPANGEKLIAITFDDGPSEYTQKYLDILAQYSAKATFFELCNNIDNYPDASRAVIAAGCQIGSHTKTHSQLTKLTPAALQSELSETFAKIQNVTGENTTIVRPPYGDMSESVWLNSNGKMSLSVLWTQDSKDWSRPGVAKIVSNALAGIQPGSIILMHDGGGNRDQDLEALPQILKTLTAQGYKFVTLKELLSSDPTIPQDIATCDATMPDGCVWPATIGD